ncbi:DMT family transporter [Peptoniphilus harei]|uniref:DMT family transporter n=1 Tax=Peptoniphilus harei TaxID=54005 RepID=UPI00254D8B27|nr:DMT family transporter [Peptoniphilus harei]MDK7376829.1 DMT family transporter [Peptoniphilus harei]MDK7678703.1 DMT family transporter [Peptoniphilus harei]
MKREFKASIMLFATAIIWGLAFVAQAAGMEHLGPLSFTASRCFVAVVFLYLTYKFFMMKSASYREEKFDMKRTLVGGSICGLVFTIAINLQQVSLIYTTAAKASFLTALYIVFIPVIGLFFGRRPSVKIILCIFLAMVGTYLLSIKGGLKINRGDLIVILSALVFAIHILLLTKYSRNTNAVLVSLVQFAVCGVISLAGALVLEDMSMEAILKSQVTILYVGILSSGVGFTIQLMALKDLEPVVASMICSLESVFGALFGWLILSQEMTEREIFGAIIIFLATIFAQVPIETYLEKRLERKINRG